MPSYFTLTQAERLLPLVESVLREALAYKMEFDEAEQTLSEARQRIAMAGGATINLDKLRMERARRETCAVKIKASIERVNEYGAQVKDLDIGLIDFMTLYRGRDVCLCWRLGEDGIRFWHGADEGYRGRKPIDQDFIDNHRGDAEN